MAHLLLGWELGGNRGHAVTLNGLAQALRARGHRVSFALQRLDALGRAEEAGADVWQAPVTPRLLLSTAKPKTAPPATMGDILARLGFDDPLLIEAMLAGWERLLAAIRPDLVVADFAPFLLTAARGRIPTVSVGTPFSAPPPGMPSFPSLNGAPPALSEAETAGAVNGVLRRLQREPIEALPRLFDADREIVSGFAELDPYRAQRSAPLAAPITAAKVEIAPTGGEEVFVYAPEQMQRDSPLWTALAQSGLPVRVYVASVSPDYRRHLRSLGLRVEDGPMSFEEIGGNSRLLISHGGYGFVCSGLLAGLPQVVCHFDLEKYGTAKAITGMGLGGMAPLGRLDPQRFAASLVEVYRNQELADRARAAAPAFQKRYARSFHDEAADAVEALLQQPPRVAGQSSGHATAELERVKGIEPSS